MSFSLQYQIEADPLMKQLLDQGYRADPLVVLQWQGDLSAIDRLGIKGYIGPSTAKQAIYKLEEDIRKRAELRS